MGISRRGRGLDEAALFEMTRTRVDAFEQMILHGAERDAEPVGDLTDGETVEVAQHHDFATALGQRTDRFEQRLEVLLVFQRLDDSGRFIEGMEVMGLVDRFVGDAPVAIDPARSIALVRVPAERGAGGVPDALDGFAGFRYVAAVEPAIGGPTARPIFVGRLDATSDPAWPASPFVLGGDVSVEPGTLLFALDSRFVGIVAATPSGRALVPPATLDLVVRQMTAAGAPQEADDAPGR